MAKEEYTDAFEPKDMLKLIEHELMKFGSFKNVQSMLAKYMVGNKVPDDQLQTVAVILLAEVRAMVSKLADEFDGEPNEARAKFLKRIKRYRDDFDKNLIGEVMTSDEKEVDVELVGYTSDGNKIESVEIKQK